MDGQNEEFKASVGQKEVKTVVVLGAGNWVKGQYARALAPYKRRDRPDECKVYVVYNTTYASNKLPKEAVERYNEITLENVREFEKWGAVCLNLADGDDRRRLGGIVADVVFVVTPDDTHCEMVEEWLDRAGTIIVEKPFDVDHERIRRLRIKIEQSKTPAEVWGFDHYLVRANQFVKMKKYLGFDEHLEERIHGFHFHILESGEAGLPERSASLQAGLIMDMGSHTPALVLPFGDPNTIRLNSVKAGVYVPHGGVKTSGRELIRSGMETFAEVQFSFTSVFGDKVAATACIGKCVGEYTEKYVEVVGGRNKKRKVKLDLSSFIVDFADENDSKPVTSLFPNSVELLVREVLARRHPDSLALFDPGVGQDIVARLNEWRRPIINYVDLRDGRLLGEYPAGASLEAILRALQAL